MTSTDTRTHIIHTGADLILPENRIDEDQTFEPVTYFELKVRGRRSTLTVQAASEFLYDEADVSAAEYKDIDEVPIDIIRRDDQGDEDFAVRLELFEERFSPVLADYVVVSNDDLNSLVFQAF